LWYADLGREAKKGIVAEVPDWYRTYCIQYPLWALLSGGVLLLYFIYSRFWAKKTRGRIRRGIELTIVLISGVLLVYFVFGWFCVCLGDI
jgi:hypothetical protein